MREPWDPRTAEPARSTSLGIAGPLCGRFIAPYRNALLPNYRFDGPQVLIGEPAPVESLGHISWAGAPKALPELWIIRQSDRGLHQIVLVLRLNKYSTTRIGHKTRERILLRPE